MIASKTILKEIYETSLAPKVGNNMEALKEIALEQAPQTLLNATQIKKTKSKKPKKWQPVNLWYLDQINVTYNFNN